jgi:hypothetical protein
LPIVGEPKWVRNAAIHTGGTAMNRFIVSGSILIFGVAAAACDNSAFPSTEARGPSNADADRTRDVADAHQNGVPAIERPQSEVDAAAREITDAQDKARADQPTPKD